MHARAAAIPDVSIVALVVEGQPAIVLEDAVATEPIGQWKETHKHKHFSHV